MHPASYSLLSSHKNIVFKKINITTTTTTAKAVVNPVLLLLLQLLLLVPHVYSNGVDPDEVAGNGIIIVFNKECLENANDAEATDTIGRSIAESVVRVPSSSDDNKSSFKVDMHLVENKDSTRRYGYSVVDENAEAERRSSGTHCEVEVSVLKNVDAVLLNVPDCLLPKNREPSSEQSEAIAVDPTIVKATLSQSECVEFTEKNSKVSAHIFNDPPDHAPEKLTMQEVSTTSTVKSSTAVDPYRGLQWYLNENENYSVKPQFAWIITTGGTGSVNEQPLNTIGIVDFGTHEAHEDLVDKWWLNKEETCGNGVDDDSNGRIDDCHGWNTATNTNDLSGGSHGTMVAGTVGASTFNGVGISSICSNCRMLPITVDGYISEILEGTNYIISQGVKTINYSFGGGPSPSIEHAMSVNPDVLFVISAGNSDCDIDELPTNACPDRTGFPSGYPAAYSETLLNVVSVAAINILGSKSSFSNYSCSKNRVQVAAPGSDIFTTTSNGGYRSVNGTSFSAPIVAAIAGLIRFRFPLLKPCQIRLSLISGCSKTDELKKVSSCRGFILAKRALDAAGIISSTGTTTCSTTPVDPDIINPFLVKIIKLLSFFGVK